MSPGKVANRGRVSRPQLWRTHTELSVFFSYSHADKSLARRIAGALERGGVRVWIDEGELRAGDSIIQRISDALADVQFVVALVSRHSIVSKWCQKELALAVDEGLRHGQVRVLPLRIDRVEMPTALRDVFYIDVNSKAPLQVVSRLLSDAKSHLESRYAGRINLTSATPPLSPKSAIEPKRLLRLRSAIRSSDDDTPGNAMNVLVNDRSCPAAEALYEDALDDALHDANRGFGAAGLAEIGPAAAPWIRRLITHPDDRVVRYAFDALGRTAYMLDVDQRDEMLDTVEAVITLGDWSTCERRLRNAVRGKERLNEILDYAHEVLRSQTAPTKRLQRPAPERTRRRG